MQHCCALEERFLWMEESYRERAKSLQKHFKLRGTGIWVNRTKEYNDASETAEKLLLSQSECETTVSNWFVLFCFKVAMKQKIFSSVLGHTSKWNGLLRKKCRAGTWFYQSGVDWLETDQLNVSLQSIVSKGPVLSLLNDWRSHFARRSNHEILIKNHKFKKINNCNESLC